MWLTIFCRIFSMFRLNVRNFSQNIWSVPAHRTMLWIWVDSYMASTGSCFMVTRNVSKDHFMEVGRTQNRETMALRTLTTVDLILFYHVWGPAWIETHWNIIRSAARSHMTSHYIWGLVTTLQDLRGVLGRPFEHILLGSHNFMVMALCSYVKWP